MENLWKLVDEAASLGKAVTNTQRPHFKPGGRERQTHKAVL